MLNTNEPISNRISEISGRSSRLSRRQTLTGLFICAVMALLGVFGRMVSSFMQPGKTANSYGGIIEVGFLHELRIAGSDPKPFPHGRFWLVHTDEGLSALHSSCTHLECLFSWDVENKNFICPCHGSEFSKKGQVLRGPAQRNLDWFPIELVDDSGTLLRNQKKADGAPLYIADLLGSREPVEENVSADNVRKRITVRVDTARKIVAS